jgi:predicted metal-dependent phosphotriesterase family hydrolase
VEGASEAAGRREPSRNAGTVQTVLGALDASALGFTLTDADFARQLFLSSDSEFGGSLLPEDIRDRRENIDPPEGMLFSVRRLLPRLGELGVSSEQIHVMTVENPRDFFRRSAGA